MKQSDFGKKPLPGKFCALIFIVSLLAGAAQADEWSAAQQVMQRTTDELLRRLHAESELYSRDARYLYQMIEEVVLPVMDMQTFARLTLGKHWQLLSDTQRCDFVESFQSMLTRTYGKRLLASIDVEKLKIEYVPGEKSDPGKRYQIIDTRVVLGSSETPLDVSYSLVERDEWKVFDIIIDGSSMARQLRNAYATEIQEFGFGALLERLRKAGIHEKR